MVHKFVATVVELNATSALVQPAFGENELRSSDRISCGITQLGDIGAQVGSNVEIWYKGGIMESYPAQIQAIKWSLSADLRHTEYTQQWLSKETAVKQDVGFFEHIVILAIFTCNITHNNGFLVTMTPKRKIQIHRRINSFLCSLLIFLMI